MEDEEFELFYYKIVKVTNKLRQFYNPNIDYETHENSIKKEIKEILAEVYNHGYADGEPARWIIHTKPR